MVFILHLDFLCTYSCCESWVFDNFNKCFMAMAFLLVVYCILTLQSFIYLFAMFLSFITFTQHHTLCLGFAICKYIVYTVTNRMIYTYTYYLCHATSLLNVRQHHLPNLDVLSQCPTLGSTSSIVRTMHPLNIGVPGAVSMEVDMGLRP